jgi:hypothetical protein
MLWSEGQSTGAMQLEQACQLLVGHHLAIRLAIKDAPLLWARKRSISGR